MWRVNWEEKYKKRLWPILKQYYKILLKVNRKMLIWDQLSNQGLPKSKQEFWLLDCNSQGEGEENKKITSN
jgi:hypothetical protein